MIEDKVFLIHKSVKECNPFQDVPILCGRHPRLLLAETFMVYLALEDFNVELGISLMITGT